MKMARSPQVDPIHPQQREQHDDTGVYAPATVLHPLAETPAGLECGAQASKTEWKKPRCVERVVIPLLAETGAQKLLLGTDGGVINPEENAVHHNRRQHIR